TVIAQARSISHSKAITALNDPKRASVLKNHIARIDDPRLRRAFQVAVDIEQGSPAPSKDQAPRFLNKFPKVTAVCRGAVQAAAVRNLPYRGTVESRWQACFSRHFGPGPRM